MLVGLSPARRANSGGIMQIINKLWMVLLVGGFALAGCGAGAGGAGDFAVQGVDIADCVANPFDAACDSAEFDDAKQYRLAFCSLAENTEHVRCADLGVNTNMDAGVTLETQNPTFALHPCESYPFSPNCGAIYETNRQTRAEFCALADNATAPQCIGAIASDPCILDPTRPDCGGEYKDNRTERMAFCALRTNTQNPICTTILSRPTFATWVQSFETPPFTHVSKARGADIKTYTEFLQGTANGLNTGDSVDAYGSVGFIDTSLVRTGSVAFTKGGGVSGFSFVRFDAFPNTDRAYAGILSGTDLGAPLAVPESLPDGSAPIAIWRGILFSNFLRSNRFEARIDLTNKSISSIERFSYYAIYTLNGTFSDRGVITGNFTYTDASHIRPGSLTGLIGDGGLIGAFISDENNRFSYAGGFAASPPDQLKEFCDANNNADKIACPKIVSDNFCDYEPFGAECGSNFAQARKDRVGFCAALGNAVLGLCGGATLAYPCVANPFGEDCGADYDFGRTQRYNFCVPPINAQDSACFDFIDNFCKYGSNASLPLCADAIIATPCIGNPFADTCDDSFATIGASRIVSCLKPANMQTPFCQSTITDSCTVTPFATHCGAQFDDMRAELTDFCKMGNNAIEASCAVAVAFDACIGNPFGAGCGSDFDTVRANRKEFCTPVINAGNPICDDFTSRFCTYGNNANHSYCDDAVAADSCVGSPFHHTCGAGYSRARGKRMAWCSRGANALDDVCVAAPCSRNPFGQGCSSDAYASIRVERIGFCALAGNENHSLCAEVNARITTARWVQGFDYPLPPAALIADTGNKFLLGTRDGLDVGDLRDDAGAPPTVHTLNMRNGAGGENLAGSQSRDSSNGVGFFHYTPAGGTTRYYAGLFSGVNLGAPLVNPVVNPDGFIVWHGWLHETGLRTPIPISFDINLSTRRFHAFELVGHVLYEFTTDFDAQGVITGRIRKSINRDNRYGTVHGLIGEAGAIGAFVSDEVGGRGFAGGFIARPPSE